MNTSHLLLVALLASVCAAAPIGSIKARDISNPFVYGKSFMLTRNSSPAANCLRQSNVTGMPINCDSSYSDLTSFIITGPTVTASTTALSPTTSASLAPSGTTSPSTQWCFPKNSTGFTDPFTILCNGAATFPWFQLVKTGGVYGDGIYSGDIVALNNTRNAKFCGGNPLNCNTETIELADKFTIIFV